MLLNKEADRNLSHSSHDIDFLREQRRKCSKCYLIKKQLEIILRSQLCITLVKTAEKDSIESNPLISGYERDTVYLVKIGVMFQQPVS